MSSLLITFSNISPQVISNFPSGPFSCFKYDVTQDNLIFWHAHGRCGRGGGREGHCQPIFLTSSDLRKVYLNLAPYYNYHKKSMLISCVLLLSVVNR